MSENRPHEVGEVTLAGITYPFKTPKIAIVLSAMIRARGKSQFEQEQIVMEAQAKWMRKAVGVENWAKIEARLFDDDDDPLDWPDINDAFQEKLAEQKNGGRPTTSSSDSQLPSPTTTPSEEKPKQPESIFGD
jgi:hypothetical protein